jgi:hypothetical protein
MKSYRASGGIAPRILTSAPDGDEWSASRLGRFAPRERAPGTHWMCVKNFEILGKQYNLLTLECSIITEFLTENCA